MRIEGRLTRLTVGVLLCGAIWPATRSLAQEIPERIGDEHLPLLVRDRPMTVLVERLEEALDAGRSEEAMTLLRRLQAAEGDGWYFDPALREVSSLRQRVERRVQSSSLVASAAWSAWERELRGRLSQAGSESALWQMIGEGGGSEAVGEAALRLAGRLTDHGDLSLAVAVLAAAGRGDVASAQSKLLVRLSGAVPDPNAANGSPSRGIGAQRFVAGSIRPLKSDPLVPGWWNPAGNADGVMPIAAGLPVMDAEWFADDVDGDGSVLRQWQNIAGEIDESAVMSLSAVIAGEWLVTRNASTVTCRRLTDGTVGWSMPTSSSLRAIVGAASARTTDPDSMWIRSLRASAEAGRFDGGSGEDWRWYGANEKLRALSSDGRLVYFLDGELELPPLGSRGFSGGFVTSGTTPIARFNRLVAMPLVSGAEGQSPQAAWTLIAADRGRSDDCHFLGAPVPVGGQLLILAEFHREIVLLAIDSENGAITWRQPLVAVPSRLTDGSERHRLYRSYSPVVAGGVAICPTGVGLAVAVDVVRRQLKWIRPVGHVPRVQDRRSIAPEVAGVIGDPSGFVSRWQVADGKVLLLAPEMHRLQALDVETGEVYWRAETREREFFVGVAGDAAIIAGPKEVRRLSLANGGILSRVPLPAPPAGQPLLLSERLIVPLLSGQRWCMDLATGTELNDVWMQGAPGCEHLFPAGERIVALRPESMAVLPTPTRAQGQLELARKQGDQRRSLVLQAELAVLERQLKLAISLFEQALKASSSPLIDPVRRRLREILLGELQLGPGSDPAGFVRLKQLSSSPAEIAEAQMLEARWRVSQGRWEALAGQLQELKQLPPDIAPPVPGDRGRSLTMRSLSADLLGAFRNADEPSRRSVFDQYEADFRKAVGQGDSARLLHLNELTHQLPEFDEARLAAADQLAAVGRLAAAEQLWLTLKASADRRISIPARQRLCELWAQGGWVTWSAREYAALAKLEPQDFGWRETWTATGVGREVRQLCEVDWPVDGRAVIRRAPRLDAKRGGRETSEMDLVQMVQGRLPIDWPVSLAAARAPLGIELGFADRRAGGTTVEVASGLGSLVPSLTRRSSTDREVATSGTLIPLAGWGRVGAISPLAGDSITAWSQSPEFLQHRSIRPICAVVRPDVTVFQSRTTLFAVSTLDGGLRWIRRDLPARSGLDQDQRFGIGIIAAGDSIGVLAPDRKEYLVYRLSDGGLQSKVALARTENGSQRDRDVVVGDSLFYVGQPADSRSRIGRLCRWSPGQAEPEVVDELHPQVLLRTVNDQYLCYLSRELSLKIYSVESRSVIATVSLPQSKPQTVPRDIRLWIEGDRLYVNLQRDSARVEVRDFHEPPRFQSLTSLDLQMVRDDLLAVDLVSGRRLWSRRMPMTGMLPLTGWRAPYWVLFSQIRRREDPAAATLRVSLFDLRTGEVIASRSDLPSQESLLGVTVDAERREISLLGLTHTLTLAVQPGGVQDGLSWTGGIAGTSVPPLDRIAAE